MGDVPKVLENLDFILKFLFLFIKIKSLFLRHVFTFMTLFSTKNVSNSTLFRTKKSLEMSKVFSIFHKKSGHSVLHF